MCDIKKFIRENPPLAAGIFLPVVLVILFALAAAIPQWTVPPPRYDALFIIDPYNNANIVINTADGHLKGQYHIPVHPAFNQHTSLYRFEAKTLSLRETVLQPPAVAGTAKPGDWIAFDLPPDLQNLSVSPGQPSPDGYTFRTRNAYEGNWLFFTHSHNAVVISKDGRNISLIPPGNSDYFGFNSVRFIGWIVPPGAAQ